MGFTEYCGITLLNNIFAKGIYTYEIPKMKRSIIDMGMTNSLRSVLDFKVLSLNLGVTPQTCHKVLELSIKIVPKPVEGKIPQVNKFNLPGNKQNEYMNCILSTFMDLSPISPPVDYNNIMNL